MAATAGYKVITLMPDDTGYPNLDALKAALYCIQARPPFPFISKYAIIIR